MEPKDIVDEASKSARALQEAPNRRAFAPSKRTCAAQGEIFARYFYPRGDDDELEDAINDYALRLRLQNQYAAYLFEHQMKVPDQALTNIACARWYEQGLPVIRLGHKRAAALMATHVQREVLGHIKPPFWAFFIELPDGLLHLMSEHVAVKATGVLVQVRRFKRPVVMLTGPRIPDGDLWNYLIVTDTSLTQWKLNRTVGQLLETTDENNVYLGFGLPRDDYDDRVDLLVSRLIASVCLMMSSPENLKERVEAVERSKTGKKPAAGSPKYRVFTEAKPINVDVRRTIKSYLGGERDSPDVRLLVRGHWKLQPYGPGRVLRRPLHIEPYWRGGEENDVIMQRIYEAGIEKKP